MPMPGAKVRSTYFGGTPLDDMFRLKDTK
jgi:hypothetical protein